MFEILETSLGYAFKDRDVLRLALSHKSHANEGRKRGLRKSVLVSDADHANVKRMLLG